MIINRVGGADAAVPVTAGMISGFNNTQLGSQTVTISHLGETITFTIIVNDFVTDIILNGMPTEVDYGEYINLSGATFSEVMASGSAGRENVAITDAMVSGYVRGTGNGTETMPGNATLEISPGITNAVTGQNITRTSVIAVNEVIVGIELTPPTRTLYNYNETLDLTGLEVREVGRSGRIYVMPSNEFTLSTTIAAPVGENVLVTITRNANNTHTGTFTITVIDNSDDITGITLVGTPPNSVYYGQNLDLSRTRSGNK